MTLQDQREMTLLFKEVAIARRLALCHFLEPRFPHANAKRLWWYLQTQWASLQERNPGLGNWDLFQKPWRETSSLLHVYMCVLVSVMFNSLQPRDYGPLGSSVHGISKARVLEWVVIPFPRKPSRPRNGRWVSCIARRFCTVWAVNYWRVKKIACTLDGETISVFQSCLLYKHLCKDSLKQDMWCLRSQNVLKCRTHMEN